MGWRGNLRTINSTLNKIDRESKRKQRELEKRHKNKQKIEELEQAKYDVEVYENYIEQIQSLHKEGSEKINWIALKNEQAPQEPKLIYTKQQEAESIFNNFKPNFFHKIFNRVEKKKQSLLKEIEKSKILDEQNYEQKKLTYKKEYTDWKEQIELATKVLNNEEKAFLDVIQELNPFEEINNLGTKLDFKLDKRYLYIDLNVHSQDIIPNESKYLLKSGKLSSKNLTKSLYHEIYQDYVCSAILRVAREVFALLPIDSVIITAEDELLNKSTGHKELLPIVSALISKEIFEDLNLNLIDTSDSMTNFIHNMDFKKTTGFKPVNKINLEE
ncbi:hypothetical protein [Arcobacter sp.]|uniref:hypothetical protein n=1 Tax=unclassified Arcobacter TaxID=2593671 RepID=UPI003AFFB10C